MTLTLWESVENKCEGDGSRAALSLSLPLVKKYGAYVKLGMRDDMVFSVSY